MSEFISHKNEIKFAEDGKVIAVAIFKGGSEIITKALNYYFSDQTYNRNQAVEMMHSHSAEALLTISDFIEKKGMDASDIIDYLREIAEQFKAQALVVSMRDELKFDKPKD